MPVKYYLLQQNRNTVQKRKMSTTRIYNRGGEI